ncbi:MAG: hypothetical protein ACYDEJ_02275 [Desulfitobacteriaceae bacterium]
MIDVDSLEQICPDYHGCGRLTDYEWEEFLSNNSNLEDHFRNIEIEEHYNLAKQAIKHEATEEPIFHLCKRCSGKGKILTDEGAKLIKFLRNWLNPNY